MPPLGFSNRQVRKFPCAFEEVQLSTDTILSPHTAEKFWYFLIFFALNTGNYAFYGQCFMCLVKDTPTAGALVGALVCCSDLVVIHHSTQIMLWNLAHL